MVTKLGIVLVLVLWVLGPIDVPAKEVVGWVEKVRIHPGGLLVKSKVDTGAKTSSLHCECITNLKQNGESWVRFTVVNYDGEKTTLVKKVERFATVKRHFGEAHERPVVRLGICLGRTYKEVEVNLIDRTGFNYQMLIGRSFLGDDFLIDPSTTFLAKPECKNAPR